MLVSSYFKSDHGYIEYVTVLDFVDIYHVEIEETSRGRGLGKRLLFDFLSHLSGQGIKEVTLEVRVDNHAALALYKTAGFETVSIRKGYYQGIDGQLMLKKFKED